MSESFAYAACMTRKALLSLSRQILTQAMHIRVPIQNFSFESTARSAQEDSVVPKGRCPTKQIIIMRIRWDLAAAPALDSPFHFAHGCVDAKTFVSYIRCGFPGDAWEASEWATSNGMPGMYLGLVPAAKTCPDPSAFWLGAFWLVHGRCYWFLIVIRYVDGNHFPSCCFCARRSCLCLRWLGFWLIWRWLGI